MERRETLIKKYFGLGLQHGEIIAFLQIIHNIRISERTLKRILAKLNLFRRKNYSNIQTVYDFLQDEVNKSSQLHGYRWMHLRCLQNGFVVTQEVVRELLNLLDPDGVDIRRRKRLRRRQYRNSGPNFLWHQDSYDKLKPYGICINGCIDGFSRHIIWLRAGRTSSNPKVIAGYYVDSIETLGGFPKCIRSDMGNENKITERIQSALTELFGKNHEGIPPFLYGRSTANQRIESWWAILRKETAQYWINIFEILKDDGYYNGAFIDKSILQFCFLEIIQNELNEVVLEWNVHKIKRSRNSRNICGRPIMMYEMPNLFNVENHLNEIPDLIIDPLKEECMYETYPCDEDVYNLCTNVMEENGYTKSNDPYDAVQLYINLRKKITDMLQN